MTAATPSVHLVFGPVGAGKSTYARALAARDGGVRFAIDDWMHELFAPDLTPALDFAWIMARVRRCEQRIRATAREVLDTGTPVVLDLGFMKAADRVVFRAWAVEAGYAVRDHFVHAPAPLRAQRVRLRNEARGETFSFEVTPAMFELMEHLFEPPDAAELRHAVVLDTAPPAP
jgi:predicted kinase